MLDEKGGQIISRLSHFFLTKTFFNTTFHPIIISVDEKLLEFYA